MTQRILPTPEQLRELLRYEPETGKLFWKPRPAEMFSSLRISRTWNSRYAGKEAFTSKWGNGYRRGGIFDIDYSAHRVIWAMAYGEWPQEEVDHINCIKDDNRICNLRMATSSENKWNSRERGNNSSGFKGVSWDKFRGKWSSKISKSGKSRFLGRFGTAREAAQAYADAADEMHGEFSRTC